MRINYVTLADRSFPSVRHRMIIPGRYVGNAFITPVPMEADIHLFSKPFTPDEQAMRSLLTLAREVPYIFDCWDNLFCRGGMDEIYTKQMIKGAVKVVTASEWLVEEIWRQTGIKAELIQDPLEYHYQQVKPLDVIKPLWFGSSSNLPVLRRLRMPYKLTIVSDTKDFTQKVLDQLPFEYDFIEWSQTAQEKAMRSHNLMVIPGYEDPAIWAKSANRVAEAINAGMSVVAYPIPAYRQFEKWIRLSEDVNSAILDPLQLVDEAQDYVTDTFHPDVIGEQWKELITSVHQQLCNTPGGDRQLA